MNSLTTKGEINTLQLEEEDLLNTVFAYKEWKLEDIIRTMVKLKIQPNFQLLDIVMHDKTLIGILESCYDEEWNAIEASIIHAKAILHKRNINNMEAENNDNN